MTLKMWLPVAATTNTPNSTSSTAPPTLLARAAAFGPPAPDPEADILRLRLLSLEQTSAQLTERFNQAEVYKNNPPPMARIHSPGNSKNVKGSLHKLKIALFS